MIDGFKLTSELVEFAKGFDDWKEAIRFSAKGLLEQGFIEETYVEAMIDSVVEYGPYIVIAPNIAMPHARPEAGTNKVGFAITVLEDAVSFSDQPEHQARLMVTLSCVSADTHLKMLQALVEILGDDALVEKIMTASSKEEILEIFQ